MVIYKITNKINGKCYIGQTLRSSPQHRWTDHCRPGKSAIKQAIQEFGKDNFDFEVIAETSSLEELNQMEMFNIQACRALSPEGYNLHTGGHNHKCSEETKAKMSEILKSRVVSEETRKLMSTNRKGKPKSAEHKAKIAEARKGKKYPRKSK
jgi:group I intron endonuclease